MTEQKKTEDQKILDDVLGDIPGVFTAPDFLKVMDTSMEDWLTDNILDTSATVKKEVKPVAPAPVAKQASIGTLEASDSI